MCGIVGYVGKRDAKNILDIALKLFEVDESVIS